jgi:anthranilate 3-monooxygenase (FAD) / 4-hydroxyphenylacetate 3-monooxygenase
MRILSLLRRLARSTGELRCSRIFRCNRPLGQQELKENNMAIRSGAQFIEGLRSRPREVWVRGERVMDVSSHPAFSRAAQQLAHLYDMQHDPAHCDTLTYRVPETGELAGTAFMPSYSHADLVKHREAYRLWATTNFGLMGRSPDFMNVTLLAFYEARELFGEGDARFVDNMAAYYRHVRDKDLFLSHALVSPQNDRSKQSSDLGDLHLRVVAERDGGILVSGARMIATLGPLADEILLYNLPGLKSGDEDHAISFAVPADAPGLRQICREPYDAPNRTSFDHPLSTRFEENDSLLIFNEVFVPWNRVFCYRDVPLANRIYLHSALRNHTAHQTNVRALIKMQFVTGLCITIARSIKADQFLHVQKMLGELICDVEFVKSGLVRSEIEAETTPVGTIRPSLAPLQALRSYLPKAYPRAIEYLQTIGAGGFMLMPSGADFRAQEISHDMSTYYAGANGMGSLDRVRLFKLAWDLAGEAFGQRLVQYERYYAGDPMRTLATTYFSTDDTEMIALVNAALVLGGEPSAGTDRALAVGGR